MKSKLLLYSSFRTPRLEFAAEFIIEELLGLELIITSSEEEFTKFDGAKINYSSMDLNSPVQIIPSGLLRESGIKKQIVCIGKWKNIPVFFMTTHTGEIKFDIFSAAFYLLSRYEEYLPFTPDIYGRFPAIDSLAYRNGFLEIPVINCWANQLGDYLQKNYDGLTLAENKFQWINSIDVDTAWAYLNKNIIHTWGSLLKSAFAGSDFLKRVNVFRGKEQDPFYTFDFLEELYSDDAEKLIFFFLSGKPGGLDRNIFPGNKNWQNLVKRVSGKFMTGIHPSVKSNLNAKIIQDERNFLESIIAKPIYSSRQHYLKLNFPATYKTLIEIGITDDFSMGFADKAGFRAGTSSPFYFYDISDEKKTELKIWPFAFMDRTLSKYMKLDIQKARDKIIELIDSVHKHGGIFMSLWHNDSLSDYGEWEGWRNVYIDMFNNLKNKEDGNVHPKK